MKYLKEAINFPEVFHPLPIVVRFLEFSFFSYFPFFESFIHLRTNRMLESLIDAKKSDAPSISERAFDRSSGTIRLSTSSIKFQSPLALDTSIVLRPDLCILPSSINLAALSLYVLAQCSTFDKVEIKSVDELRLWLQDNYKQPDSVWLVTYKKSERDNYVSRWEVLDELICFGWIDGIRRKLDDKRTMQLISQRKVEHWARTYKERAAKLIDDGRMHESGLLAIDISKANGLWNFMDDVDNLIVPDDLSKALSEIEGATDFFASINDSSKRFVLRWIKLAKTGRTREKRIQEIAELSAKGEKLPGS